MLVIDARSGQQMIPGQQITYHGGEWIKLLAVEPGIFSARAFMRRCYRDRAYSHGTTIIEKDLWVPLEVRWTHPNFFFQHVAFIPS